MNDLQRINDLEKMNDLHLRIESDAFNELRRHFNSTLDDTLKNMNEKESDSAEIKVSLKIEFKKVAHSESGEDVIIPQFLHRVTSQMAYKTHADGITGGSNYKLVFDKILQEYIMRPIERDQLSLFEI